MSALSWYDKSIVDKLRTITGDNRVSITAPDDLFRFIANLKDDDIKFPLISLSRLGYQLGSTVRTPLSSQGVRISPGLNNEIPVVDEIQAIPIRIEYQLDILTRKRDDNDEITDEILFYFINNPTLSITIGRGVDKPHVFNLFFYEEVEDNSDIESHRRNGEYFRSTMRLYVPDAYLWKMTRRVDKTIDPIKFEAANNLYNDETNYEDVEIKIDKE